MAFRQSHVLRIIIIAICLGSAALECSAVASQGSPSESESPVNNNKNNKNNNNNNDAVAAVAALAGDDECNFVGDCSLNQLQLRSAQQAAGQDAVVLQAENTEESSGHQQQQQRQAERTGESSDSGEPGTVYALYTYGAPGTSKPAFADLANPTGNFRGLRCYTENLLHTPGVDSRQIDFAAYLAPFVHPKIPTVALRWKRNSIYWPGPGAPDQPLQNVAGHYLDLDLHRQKNYVDRLARVRINGHGAVHEEPFDLAFKYAFMAYGAYDYNGKGYNEKTMAQQLASHAPDFKIVAHVVQNSWDAQDNIFIVQDRDTLDCVLVFEGASTLAELGTPYKCYGTGYCGFKDVHAGYRDKLWWLMKYSMPKLRPKLEKCNQVTVTGHSLGGALADIFSACANSQRLNDPDYRQQMWHQGTPESMTEVYDPGTKTTPLIHILEEDPPADILGEELPLETQAHATTP